MATDPSLTRSAPAQQAPASRSSSRQSPPRQTGGTGGGSSHPPVSVSQGGSNDTRTVWSEDLLRALGFPVTADNVKFLNAWQQSENTAARFNPLATTQHLPGSTGLPGNPNGNNPVQEYTSYQQGLQATVQTLKNGYYPEIMAALKSGRGTSAAGSANLDTWGTGSALVSQTLRSGGGSGGPTPALSQDVSGSQGPSYGQGLPQDNGVPGLTPATNLSWKDLATFYGYSSAFFQSDPSLRELVDQAVGKGWTVDEFKARLQATPWFQKHSQAQQQWQVLLTGSPAEAQRQIQAKATELEHQAAVLGATLSQADATKFATQALQNGLTDTEITNGLVGHITKQKTAGAYSGSAGEAETQIRQIAADYGVPVSQQYIQSVIPGLVGGTKNLNDITDYFKTVASSMYPGLAKQIASGVTVKQAADPYVSSMANLLEIDPSQINFTKDPLVSKALQFQGAKSGPNQAGTDGAPGVMPLWQFQQQVRQDPRWQYTDNAKQEVMGMAHSVLQQWGLMF